jgi:hypothetical protein
MTDRKSVPSKIACFVSVPKCASKSILDMLALGEERDEDSAEKTERFVIYENHQRLSVLEARYDLRDKYIFAFVRNPYDRLASWYQYHLNMEPYRSLSFEAWIRQGCPTHWVVQNRTDWRQEGLSPLLQFNFLSASHTQPSFVGRMETFDDDMKRVVEDLNRICRQRGIEHRFGFRDIRVNASRSDLPTYTPGLRDIVFRLFRKDFDAFGYQA